MAMPPVGGAAHAGGVHRSNMPLPPYHLILQLLEWMRKLSKFEMHKLDLVSLSCTCELFLYLP